MPASFPGRRADLYRDLAEEMREHIDEKTEQFIRGGLAREEAEHAARRAFGNTTMIEERGREVWQWPRAGVDLGGREIWAAAVLEIAGVRRDRHCYFALGIGVNAAIFGLSRPFCFASALP